MDVTAGILYHQLQKQFYCITNLTCEIDFPIMGFRVWEGEKPEKGILYLCNQNIPDGKAWRQVLVLGAEGIFKTDRHSPYIAVREPMSFFQLINLVQDVFQKCYHQYLYMDRIINQNNDWKEILNELEQIWDVAAVLADTDLKYIAMSDSYRSCNSWLGEDDTLPLEIADNLMSDENFFNAVNHEQSFLYVGDEGNLYSYCYNIRIKGDYAARFMIQSREGKAFYGGLSLAQIIVIM